MKQKKVMARDVPQGSWYDRALKAIYDVHRKHPRSVILMDANTFEVLAYARSEDKFAGLERETSGRKLMLIYPPKGVARIRFLVIPVKVK